MRTLLPVVLRVPPSRLTNLQPVAWHVLARGRLKRGDSARLKASFRFKNDELRFARQLVRRKSNYWVFRSNQQKFCGDFVVVELG